MKGRRSRSIAKFRHLPKFPWELCLFRGDRWPTSTRYSFPRWKLILFWSSSSLTLSVKQPPTLGILSRHPGVSAIHVSTVMSMLIMNPYRVLIPYRAEQERQNPEAGP